ncbi:MAG: hypothetical protein JSR82_01175 [Verrucomicrobia bacterium]|nr:hypothetical protein [Verrucomicrobiota bacterium]
MPAHLRLPALCAALLLAATGPLGAQMLVNQLDPSMASVSSGNAQIFEASFVSSNGLMVDDFTLSSGSLLTRLDAAFTSNRSGTGFENVLGFQISIFSSLSAVLTAGNALLGNVASIFVPVGLTTSAPFNAYNGSSTVFQIPLSLSLPAGTYYLGVAPRVDFLPTGYQTFMLQHFGPGGNNAYLFVPGQGIINFRNSDTTFALYGTVAVVPEASTWGVGLLAAVLLLARQGGWRRVLGRNPSGLITARSK